MPLRGGKKKEQSDTVTLFCFPIDPLNTNGPDLPPGTIAEHRAAWHMGLVAPQRDLHL